MEIYVHWKIFEIRKVFHLLKNRRSGLLEYIDILLVDSILCFHEETYDPHKNDN